MLIIKDATYYDNTDNIVINIPIMKYLLVAILLSVCLSWTISNDDRVLIELYTESLCPDCLSFILSSFKKAITTADIYKIADIRVYPYGNARWAKNGSTYSFTCQHGARECDGNIIEVCAQFLSTV
jgi:interferon gamma-inducible protein 30